MITGRRGKIDLDDIDVLIREYLSFKGERRRVEFAFFGGNFLGLPQKEIKVLLDHLKPWMDKGMIQAVRCSTRPDTITGEMLDLVVPYGLNLVELGVQSMDNQVLEKAERGHTREDTLAALEMLKSKGVRAGVQVMTGLPGDSMEKAMESVKILASLKPDLARIYPLLVLNGSKLAQWYKCGEYLPLSLDQAVVQAKEMFKIFDRAGVPVVRMGLQAGEMMDDSEQMLAGPWHPAFGHLVYSAVMFDRACEAIDAERRGKTGEKITLKVHPQSLSRLQGNKKENIDRLAARYPDKRFIILTDKILAPDQILAFS